MADDVQNIIQRVTVVDDGSIALMQRDFKLLAESMLGVVQSVKMTDEQENIMAATLARVNLATVQAVAATKEYVTSNERTPEMLARVTKAQADLTVAIDNANRAAIQQAEIAAANDPALAAEIKLQEQLALIEQTRVGIETELRTSTMENFLAQEGMVVSTSALSIEEERLLLVEQTQVRIAAEIIATTMGNFVAENELITAKEMDAVATRNLAAEQLFLSGSMVVGQRGLGGMLLGLMGMTGGSMAALVAIVALGAGLASAAANSMKWQEQMVLLQNNTNATDETIRNVGKDILNFGASVGASFDSMAIGARKILDYGFSAAGAVTILNEATSLAVATGSKEEDVAQAAAQALHQYGASADEASKYLGILYESSLQANSTVADFTDNLKKVTGLGAAIGVPFEQVAAAVASLTRNLGDNAQAQTQVVNILRFILRPTKDEADAWDEFSKKSGDAALSAKNLGQTLSEEGLTGILDRVRAGMQSLNLTQAEQAKLTFDVINGQRGGLGMLVLLNNGYDDYTKALKANSNETKRNGDMTEAAARQAATAENAWHRLGDTWIRLSSEGTGFNDVMKTIAESLSVAIKVVSEAVIIFEGLGRMVYYVAQQFDNLLRGITSGDWTLWNQGAKDMDTDMASLNKQLKDLWQTTTDDTKAIDDLAAAALACVLPTDALAIAAAAVAGGTAMWLDPAKTMAEVLKAQEEALAKVAPQAEAYKMSLSELSTYMGEFADALGKDGAKGGVAYLKGMLEKLATLPLAAQQAIAPLLTWLQDELGVLQGLGEDAGLRYTFSMADGMKVNYDPVMSILGQYSTAFDMRQLFSTLGIQTGDNYAQAVYDRIAAWYEPIKAQLMSYLKMAEITADALIMKGVSPTDPRALAAELAATTLRNAVSQLEGVKAKVDTAAAANIAEHNAKQAKAGGTATDPSIEAAADQSKKQAVENAMAALQELMAETRLRQEKQDLADAQQHLTDVTKDYDSLLKEVTDAEENSKRTSEERTHSLQVTLHGLQGEMRTAQAIAENMLKPLIAAAQEAKDKLKALQDETKSMDETFEQMAHPAEVTLQNLSHDSQDLADKLRDIEDAERTAMAAINATLATDQAAVEAAQSALDSLTAHYEALIGKKQEELDLLTQADTRRDEAKQLGNMAQSVADLQARMENAIPGTKQYYELQKQLKEAEASEKNKAKEFTLQDQIAALKDEEAAATKAAEARVKSAQAVLKAEQEVAKTTQANFAQEKENIRAKQEENDKATEVAQKELTNIKERKAEYDYEQKQKEINAQKDVDRTTKALADQKLITDGYIKSVQDQMDKLSLQISEESYQEGERDRQFEKVVSQLGVQKTAAVDAATAIVDALNAIYGDDQKAQDNQTFADKFAKATGTLKTAILEYQTPLGHAADKSKDFADYTALVNLANGVLTTALNTQVTPAMQNFTNAVQPGVLATQKTFMKYLGTPALGGDPTVSVEWYMDGHNKEGLYARMITHADISLGEQGLKGMAELRMGQFATSILGILEQLATDSGVKSYAVGTSMLDGIARGLADVAGNASIAAAMAKVVADAIAAGQKAAEQGSPSRRAARELGMPLAEGVAMGISAGSSMVYTSMRSLVDGVAGYGSITGSGRAGGGNNVMTTVGDVHVTLSFPNVRDGSSLPRDRESFRGIGVAVNQAMTYDMVRRGIPTRQSR